MSSQAEPDSYPKPAFITGGCLCGGIRYRVDFPNNHDFIQNSGTCQCTQCRRNSGSLVAMWHVVPLSSLTYTTDPSPPPMLRMYSSSPGVLRGSCARCGGFLSWRKEGEPAIGVAVGTIDPEFLLGTDGGQGFAKALVWGAGSHCWCKNGIPGVTDWVGESKGMRFAEETDGEQWTDKSVP